MSSLDKLYATVSFDGTIRDDGERRPWQAEVFVNRAVRAKVVRSLSGEQWAVWLYIGEYDQGVFLPVWRRKRGEVPQLMAVADDFDAAVEHAKMLAEEVSPL